MKILLISSSLAKERYASGKEGMPCLGISYIASFLRTKGHNVTLVTGDSSHLDVRLRDADPGLVGISSMTPSFPAALEIAGKIKKYCKAPVVLGGPHATALAEGLMKAHDSFDFIAYGEGEETLTELAETIETGSDTFDSIKGLVWRRKGGEIVRNSPRGYLHEIDRIPFPAVDLLGSGRTNNSHYYMGFRNAVPMMTSRGCPFRCSYCASHITMGRQYRVHSVSYILNAIEKSKALGAKSVIFWDDTLTLMPERLEQLCEGMIKRDFRLPWYCLTRSETITEKSVRLMKKAGCSMVSFGVESASKIILDKVHKQVDLEKIMSAVKLFKDNGIRVQSTFILGLPFDDLSSINETIEFAKKLSPTFAIFFRFVPYPGTDIISDIKADCMPKETADWETFVASEASGMNSFTQNLSSKGLSLAIKKAYREFYLRPGKITDILRTIRSFGSFTGYAQSFVSLLRMI